LIEERGEDEKQGFRLSFSFDLFGRGKIARK